MKFGVCHAFSLFFWLTESLTDLVDVNADGKKVCWIQNCRRGEPTAFFTLHFFDISLFQIEFESTTRNN